MTKQATNRFCRWGMHLPGPTKVFHRGHVFTRCVECDATLVIGHKGWQLPPRSKHVVWRDRTPADRLFAVSPNHHRARLKFDPVAALLRR